MQHEILNLDATVLGSMPTAQVHPVVHEFNDMSRTHLMSHESVDS